MSRILIKRLAEAQQEFEAAGAAIAYVGKQWSIATDDTVLKGVSYS